jgi:hypothetical protein
MAHFLTISRTWSNVFILIAILLVSSSNIFAHSSSNAFLTFTHKGETPQLTVDLNIRDLDIIFDFDSNKDGKIQWSEIALKEPEVLLWIKKHIQVFDEEKLCDAQNTNLLARDREDGFYLSVNWHAECGKKKISEESDLSLIYTVFLNRDTQHRGLLNIEMTDDTRSLVLTPQQLKVSLQPQKTTFWASLKSYFIDGMWHIWIGVDHILFLLSLLLLAPLTPSKQAILRWKPADNINSAFIDVLKVVTSFTLAHSITLALSVLEIIVPTPKLIESFIALSIVLAALNNLLGWFSFRRWKLAFAFGLIHGFGFANVLIDLGLPPHSLALALLGFNLGVEFGQIVIVVIFFGLAWWIHRTNFYRVYIVIGGSLAIATIGIAWTIERMSG